MSPRYVGKPYHNYYLVLPISKAAAALKAAEEVHVNKQHALVRDAFEAVYQQPNNPIKQGKLYMETPDSLGLIREEFRLEDINLVYGSPMMQDMFHFRCLFRSHVKSFAGEEYALEIEIYVDNKPGFPVHLKNQKFVTLEKGGKHESKSHDAKTEA